MVVVRLLARDETGAPVMIDVDHDAIRAALTPEIVDDLIPTLAGEPGTVTLTVPARILATRGTLAP